MCDGLTDEVNRPNREPDLLSMTEARHGWVRVERRVSEQIGSLIPPIARKKLSRYGPLWLRCGKVVVGAAEDRSSSGAQCPRVSVVMGDVSDIGESVRRCAAAESISRLRE